MSLDHQCPVATAQCCSAMGSRILSWSIFSPECLRPGFYPLLALNFLNSFRSPLQSLLHHPESQVCTDRFKGKPRPPAWQCSSACWGLKNKKHNASLFFFQDTWLNTCEICCSIAKSCDFKFCGLLWICLLQLPPVIWITQTHLVIHSHSRQVLKLPLLGEKTPAV